MKLENSHNLFKFSKELEASIDFSTMFLINSSYGSALELSRNTIQIFEQIFAKISIKFWKIFEKHKIFIKIIKKLKIFVLQL